MDRFVTFCILIFLISCKTSSIFKKDLHAEYGQKLIKAGLENTALGKQWFDAAARALSAPQQISIPYKELGYFSLEKPRAAGLRFLGKRGEKILFQVSKNPATNFPLYADLWELDKAGKTSMLMSVDTAKASFEFEVEKDVALVLRLQPELLNSGDYTLSISIGPSLGFPVQGKVGKIGSYWGDARDGGGRSHEGIDIFAPKRTVAVAAADGKITSVTENNLGGKVVFMRPFEKNYTLYYAHLDEQFVSTGQNVRKGDTIGLVGNTGNAKTTPPHLHFGIYASGGAIDPLPFVNPDFQQPPKPIFSPQLLSAYLRLTQSQTLKSVNSSTSAMYKKNTLLKPLTSFANKVLVELPDGLTALISINGTEPASTVLRKIKTFTSGFLLESPSILSPKKQALSAAIDVNIYAYFNEFAFVKLGDTTGWLSASAFK